MVNLLYGLDLIKDRLVHVDFLGGEFKERLVCPECKRPLVPKRGQIRKHHFAHLQDSAAFNCNWKPESIIHRRAKEILTEFEEISIPEYKMPVHNFYDRTLIKESKFNYDEVELEKYVRKDLKPDAILSDNGFELYVEVIKTHGIDEDKMRKIDEVGKPVLTIDVSSFVDSDFDDSELVNAVITDIQAKTLILPKHFISDIQRDLPDAWEQFKFELSNRYGKHIEYFPRNRYSYHNKSVIDYFGFFAMGCLKFEPLTHLFHTYDFFWARSDGGFTFKFEDSCDVYDRSGVSPCLLFSKYILHFPVLDGSPSDVSFANKWRKEHLYACLKILRKYSYASDEVKTTLFDCLLKEFWQVNRERNTLSASYWIEHRPINERGILSEFDKRTRDETYFSSSGQKYLAPWPFTRNLNETLKGLDVEL